MYEELPPLLKLWAEEFQLAFIVEQLDLEDSDRVNHNELWTLVMSTEYGFVEIRPGYYPLPLSNSVRSSSAHYFDDTPPVRPMELSVCFFITQNQWGESQISIDVTDEVGCFCLEHEGECEGCRGYGGGASGPCQLCGDSGAGDYRDCGACGDWGVSVWGIYHIGNDLIVPSIQVNSVKAHLRKRRAID